MSEIDAKELAAKYKRHKPVSEQPRHDGKLDDCDEAKVQYGAMYPGEMGIYIRSVGDAVYLNGPQSLRLFAWLQQEKETLEQIVKEQAQ